MEILGVWAISEKNERGKSQRGKTWALREYDRQRDDDDDDESADDGDVDGDDDECDIGEDGDDDRTDVVDDENWGEKGEKFVVETENHQS